MTPTPIWATVTECPPSNLLLWVTETSSNRPMQAARILAPRLPMA